MTEFVKTPSKNLPKEEEGKENNNNNLPQHHGVEHHRSRSGHSSRHHHNSHHHECSSNSKITPSTSSHIYQQPTPLSNVAKVATTHRSLQHQPSSVSMKSISQQPIVQSAVNVQQQQLPISELKKGTLLKYKKRIFKSNWRETDVSLYSNATIISRHSKSDSLASLGSDNRGETRIQMTNQTTLIIFGRQLKDVPKKPILPSGYRMEQLLAIGLIHSTTQKSIDTGHSRMTIVFHWFLLPTIAELFDWIVAINNSIPNNKQIITNDELTMSLVMAEATHFNNLMLVQDMVQAQQENQAGHHIGGHENASLSDLLSHHHGHHHGLHGHHPYYHSSHHHLGVMDQNSLNILYDNYFADAGVPGGAEMVAADTTTGTTGTETFDCGGDFDDCSAFAAADAFAIF